MISYYGGKNKMIGEIMAVSPIRYEKYVELCAGNANVARKMISGVPKSIVEFDIGQATFLQQVRDNPIELVMGIIEKGYSRDAFETALENQTANYVGMSQNEIATDRGVLLLESYNASCNSYRNIDSDCVDDIKSFVKAQKMRRKFETHLLRDICRMSEELSDTQIIYGNMMDYLYFLEDEDSWVNIDPPYRPKLRSAGKKGYNKDWTEELHLEFCEKLKQMYEDGRLNAKVSISCYVDENLKEDMYCKYLLSCGFRLVFLKQVYLPKICTDNQKTHKKTKVYECMFTNYDDMAAPSRFGDEQIYTFNDVFVNETSDEKVN